MPLEREALLRQLLHDVNSKCSSLKSAAGLLRESSPEEARELLRLMAEEARSLAKVVGEAARRLGG